MNKEQENIAENFIKLLKDNKGLLKTDNIPKEIFNPFENKIAIINGLIELKLIESKTGGYFRLTETGWEFESFDNLKADKKLDNEIKYLTHQELKGNIFHLKFWWLMLLINALVSLIISLIIN